MDGVHDLGGMHGFGPVPIEADEPVFHEVWEGRVWYMTGALGRRVTTDRVRYTIEQMPPGQYLTSSYYLRWLWAAEHLARDPEVLADASRSRPRPLPTTPLWSGRFRPGDRVQVRNTVTAGHARVPRYLRRAVGRVERAAFAWPNPTRSAETGSYGEPELVYTVAFPAAELFGPPADHTLAADLAESDLEGT
ncbi:MAG: SH3-like domain-containing protein [Acidimicrobiales bacterium]